jgi:hypothetical protein
LIKAKTEKVLSRPIESNRYYAAMIFDEADGSICLKSSPALTRYERLIFEDAAPKFADMVENFIEVPRTFSETLKAFPNPARCKAPSKYLSRTITKDFKGTLVPPICTPTYETSARGLPRSHGAATHHTFSAHGVAIAVTAD